jgi:hypothetical protein
MPTSRISSMHSGQSARASFVIALLNCAMLTISSAQAMAEEDRDVPEIVVRGARTLPIDRIACQRIPLGVPDDYKPCVARLPDGRLLLSCFHQHQRDGGKVMEQNLLFRSSDGGLSWTGPEELPLLGREPYLSVLADGTVFMTGHLLAQDVRNEHGYTHGLVHRSTDGGHTWSSLRLDSAELGKPGASNHSSRNVLELSDGSLLLGVDCDGGGGPYFTWRSTDRGETWQRDRPCRPEGFQSIYGFFGGETVLWQARGGKVIALVRVDSKEFPIVGREGVAGTEGDQEDHEMLWESDDLGRTFRPLRDWGDYGQMYPSLLRLADGRLLYTFTVRALHPPLGVQALLGTERDVGFTFDFDIDRLVIDGQTPIGMPQGGGFGPTVQLDDGTLVTSYSYRGADDKTHVEVARWRLP